MKNQPKVFNGTTNGVVFARQVEAYCRTIEGVSPYQKILIQLSYMKGPKVREWVSKMYKEASIRVSHDINTPNDPALWTWFQQIFDLGHGNTMERNKAMKAILKLRMIKGDVEAYIERFETLRRSIDWPENANGTMLSFQRGLGRTHTAEIQAGKAPHPTTLKEWYAAARNQLEKKKEINRDIDVATDQAKESINEIDRLEKEVKNDIAHAAGINTVRFAPESTIQDGNEAVRWRKALIGRGETASQKEISNKRGKRKRPRTGEQTRMLPTKKRIAMPEQIILPQDMTVDRANASPKNALYVGVKFEHSQGKETACTLVDSGTTENFVDLRTAERWKLPRRTLPNPRPIVNMDGTTNKAGAVTEACILEVLQEGRQQLQRFYVMDLGFD
jgi:hypothetical protein